MADLQIYMVLAPADPTDEDPDDDCGITEEANDRLMNAVMDAGFEIVDGPQVWHG